MPQAIQLIAKLLFASTVSVFLCANACLYSYAAYYEQETEEARTVQMSDEYFASGIITPDIDSAADDSSIENDNVRDASTSNQSTNAVGNQNTQRVPDGIPGAIGQSDGTVYTYQEEIQDDNGKSSYVYSSGDVVEFDDGGLGDAELILN